MDLCTKLDISTFTHYEDIQVYVYVLTPMDRATLPYGKLTISCTLSIISTGNRDVTTPISGTFCLTYARSSYDERVYEI